jgi:polysaccharide export outer membrane protein
LRPGMRLSDALRAAGGVRSDAYLESVLISRLTATGDRVQLRTRLRDTTGAAVDDMLLREDDEVRVFSRSEFRPERFIAVAGAVRSGGQFPYRDGMTMRDAILLAGGAVEGAYLAEAEIARLPNDRSKGVLAQTIRVPMDSTYLFERGPDGRYLGPPGLTIPARRASDVILEPYDNVLVFREPDFQLHQRVSILGEVRFPGEYTLTSRNESLTDLIKRAGGVTQHGYAQGAVFRRKDFGRVDIDVSRALRDPRSRDNLALVPGDEIMVPAYSPIVKVSGAVSAPASVAHVRGADLHYYIEAAGGLLPNGDLQRS